MLDDDLPDGGARAMGGPHGTVIALLGAESTGKTTLAAALAEALSTDGHRVAGVGEYLREFCERHGRVPHQHEQRAIAAEQTCRIDAAAQTHDIVVADTSALMIAVYSDVVFGDLGLYDDAAASHARCDLTLLMALDLPWRPDGLQRDGPHVREPVDGRVRGALDRAALPYAIVCGTGEARLQAALTSVRRLIGGRVEGHAVDREGRARAEDVSTPSSAVRWRWHCERCGDSACERGPA